MEPEQSTKIFNATSLGACSLSLGQKLAMAAKASPSAAAHAKDAPSSSSIATTKSRSMVAPLLNSRRCPFSNGVMATLWLGHVSTPAATWPSTSSFAVNGYSTNASVSRPWWACTCPCVLASPYRCPITVGTVMRRRPFSNRSNWAYSISITASSPRLRLPKLAVYSPSGDFSSITGVSPFLMASSYFSSATSFASATACMRLPLSATLKLSKLAPQPAGNV